jgi:hypothetical protein
MVVVVTLGLLFLDQPLQQLAALEDDEDRALLLAAVDEVLDRLAADPGDRRLGSIHMTMSAAGPAHVTPVRPYGWSIVWRVASDADLQIMYIGSETG